MDAKVEHWVVTPRQGKAVEINALWYNALCILEYLLIETGDKKRSAVYRERAKKVSTSFNRQFWNENKQCLFDFIDGANRNEDVRPNQVFTLSLPFKLLTEDKALKVLSIVEDELVTSRGLRSLSPDHPDYKPTYVGNIWSRDGAYHQGTVWSFLLGAYIDSVMFLKKKSGKKEATDAVRIFIEHLNEGCVGSVSEIFDADAPHHFRGCAAQAWGVAEILRVAVEHKLLTKPGNRKSGANAGNKS
jgi:glycogen debranching enzyme